ncbi:alpha/beta hydrolase [Fodinibius saliphilus]|uniref:alpha/beta hydrolase n=1 Tax=Fodinibius saliphilus TaxID=1920650 RepID=UPI0011080E5D|nr:alpha/beta fold hydrolase [Fodinibius saliphilus]
MRELLMSGETTFEIEVPFKLLETGKSDEKPLIVYLHGFKQNIKIFEGLVEELLDIDAYHLFIQAPYPIYDRNREKSVKEWGRAWYLYDGSQEQFTSSLEATSEFLEETINKIRKQVSPTHVTVLGYSMGGYLAGYFGLSRWKYVKNLIIVGARIKTEIFEGQQHPFDHMNVLALHGANDRSVKSTPQRKCCNQLSKWGANVTFKELEDSHALSSLFLKEIKQWLFDIGYC